MTNITDIELVFRTPEALTPTERSAFIAMVIEGGEVAGLGLATNVINAHIILFLKQGDVPVGCAALKRPQVSYRHKIIKKSGVDLSEERFSFELGYVFIREAIRGLGQSHRLIDAALLHADRAAVFATARSDNVPMQRSLAKAKFESATTYLGRNQVPITLFLRRAELS